MKIILDTSAALTVVMRGEAATSVMPVLETATVVLSPQFARVEIGNALWKYMRWQEMPIELAFQHFDESVALIDVWLDDAHLMPQALRLAARYEHPVYDMLYVAAAMQQGAKLMSLDRKLMKVASAIDPQLIATI